MTLRISLALLVVFVSAGTGHGQRIVTIDTNTVYDYVNPLCFDCDSPLRVVDGDNPPTVLDIVAPALLLTSNTGSLAVELRGTSILNMSGGGVSTTGGSTVLALSQSTVNVSGGNISNPSGHAIAAWDRARVNITGGEITGGDDGDVNALRLNGEATAEISGGTLVGDMSEPAITVTGNGHVTIRGGELFSHVFAMDSSTIDIHSGTFGPYWPTPVILGASDDSVVNIYGGDFHRGDNSNRDLAEVNYRFDGNDQATVNIFGADFSTEPWIEDRLRLRGRLADGNELDVIIRGNVVLHEVPEPSTMLLAFLGLLLLRHGRSTVVTLGAKT